MKRSVTTTPFFNYFQNTFPYIKKAKKYDHIFVFLVVITYHGIIFVGGMDMKKRYKIIVAIIVAIVFLLSSFYLGYLFGMDTNKSYDIDDITGTYQLFGGTKTVTVTIEDQDNLYYQNGFEDENIKVKTQINKLYENLYLLENEKLSYNLVLFEDDYLLLIDINNQTYDKLEKVSDTPTFIE